MRFLFWFFLFIFLAVVIATLAGIYWLQLPQASGSAAAPVLQSLRVAAAPKQAGEIPPWMFLLIASFVALQLLPLLLASRVARSKTLTRADMREVTFLCEVPMYLGLLGSLLGVCATQFTTGSLAAPLAYLTTISGIVLYLLGRYTIWLPLPHEYGRDDW